MTKRMGLTAIGCLAALLMTAAAQAQTLTVAGTMGGNQENPPISPAQGAFGFTFCTVDVTAEVANCTVTFYNIASGITLSHIHAGLPGANGPVICNATPQTPLTASNDGRYTWRCDSTNFQAQANAGIRSVRDMIEAIVSGATYMNIHTTNNPGGEIRGQLCYVDPTGNNGPNPTTGINACAK
jgi:hypothetical protein